VCGGKLLKEEVIYRRLKSYGRYIKLKKKKALLRVREDLRHCFGENYWGG
jgi:uncharacterized protein YcgL (UPF0745 family)